MSYKNPYFFIIGCPRSGTTMLASLLSKHSLIIVPPETHYFSNTIKETIPDEMKNHFHFVEKLKLNLRMQDLKIDYDSFLIYFKTNYKASYKDMFVALGNYYAELNKKEIFGEKTPNHLEEVEKILEWYPQSRIILIVRDGRDVVMSLKNVPWIHNDTRRLSYLWKKRACQGINVVKKYPNHIYEIKYEEILENPKDAMKNIFQFLNIECEDTQLEDKKYSSVMPEWEKEWKKNINGEVSSSNKHKWIQNASNEEKCIMQFVMKHTLSVLNYNNDNLQVCSFLMSLKNWFYYFIFETRIKSLALRIKKVIFHLISKPSVTKPKLDVTEYLQKKDGH